MMETFPVERRRWMVLGLSSCLALMQCLNWFTFSSVSVDRVRAYYGSEVIRSRGSIDLLLVWGAVMGLGLSWVPAQLLAAGGGGLRRTAIIAAVLLAVGASLRTVPCLWASHFDRAPWLTFAFLVFGRVDQTSSMALDCERFVRLVVGRVQGVV